MALKGTFYGSTQNTYIIPKIVWSATQSTTGNYSTVTATLYYSRTNSGYETSGIGTFGITINGTTKSETKNIKITYNSNTVAVTSSVKVPHNADGTKTITISGSGVITGTTLSSTTISANVTLDTIPRKSSLAAGNGTLGTAQTLTISRASSGFTHSIRYTCGSASVAVVTKTSSTSISFTPPLTLAAQNTTGTTVSITFTLYTFSGDTQIGTTTKTISCSIPASVKPTCELTVSDAAGYAATFDGYVQGQSQLAISVTPTLAHSSPIASYSVSADGKTYSAASVTTPVLSGSGSLTVSATVKDKRGRSGTDSEQITVLAYTAPHITSLAVHRCDEDGTENDQGEYVKVTFSSSVTSLSSKNTAAYTLAYKQTSGTAFTTVSLPYANNYAVSGASYIFAADSGSSYDVRITVADYFQTETRSTTASTARTLMHWNAEGDGIAFGKLSEKHNAFECAFEVFDRFGTEIGNGLAAYTGSGDASIDPDTTLEALILTNKNTPTSAFYFVETMFYSTKSATANRAQTAIPYNANGLSSFRRYMRDGVWSEWTNHDGYALEAGADDPDTTAKHLILTNVNTPMGDGYFMYVSTMFWGDPATTGNKAQIATPHRNIGSMYHRYCVSGTWSEWRRHVNADEFHESALKLMNVSSNITQASQTNYTLNWVYGYARGGVLDLHLSVSPATTSTSWVTVATLPAGYRPPTAIYRDVPYWNAALGNANLRMRIQTGGAIQVAQGTSGVSYAFHDAFVLA